MKSDSRRIVQIAGTGHSEIVFVLDSDGTLWRCYWRIPTEEWCWERLPALPAPNSPRPAA